MAVSSINSYSVQTSLTDILTQKNDLEKSAAGDLSKLTGSNISGFNEGTLSSYMLSNSEALQKIFDEIASLTGGTVTFSAVREYQEELQRQFNEAVKKDLTEMGVDPEVTFTLASNGNGGISVLSEHTDKEKIELYFKVNPEMVDAFNKIQTLSNLDKARREQGLSVEDLKSRIQIESLAQWWSTEGTEYSQYIFFDEDNMLQYLGVNSRT